MMLMRRRRGRLRKILFRVGVGVWVWVCGRGCVDVGEIDSMSILGYHLHV